jgi:hypothetical protein
VRVSLRERVKNRRRTLGVFMPCKHQRDAPLVHRPANDPSLAALDVRLREREHSNQERGHR